MLSNFHPHARKQTSQEPEEGKPYPCCSDRTVSEVPYGSCTGQAISIVFLQFFQGAVRRRVFCSPGEGWCCHWLREVRKHHQAGEVICCAVSNIYIPDAWAATTIRSPRWGPKREWCLQQVSRPVPAIAERPLRIGWTSTARAPPSWRTRMQKNRAFPRASGGKGFCLDPEHFVVEGLDRLCPWALLTRLFF